MYWDVVEVKPEPDYCLFVRFKDGLEGRVKLSPARLTGALAPLLGPPFFQRVFIDHGAVAWPGEIDLAPDEMYTQVTFRNKLPRFYELKDLIVDPSKPDAYFQNFEAHLKGEDVIFETFAHWEKNLQELDSAAWNVLKRKASGYLQRRDPSGRAWQQLFDVLGEASAYGYLKSDGCLEVHFIPESKHRTPDLEGMRDNMRVLCEVKTMNVSDAEIRRRTTHQVVKGSNRLSQEFLGKLGALIENAKTQLQSYDPSGSAQHVVYINICFDGSIGTYHPWKEDYLNQIRQHLMDHAPGVEIVVNPGVSKEQAQVVASR